MSFVTISIGRAGMQSAQDRIDHAAARIARWGAPSPAEGGAAPPSDLATALVGQRIDSLLYTANLRTVQAADSLLGSLLDTTA